MDKDAWDITIIAPNAALESKYINYSLLNEVTDNCTVYRTIDISPYNWFSSSDTKLAKLIKKIINKTCSYICIPDSHIFWVPFAIIKGIALCRKNKYQVIYSTSPPHSTHIISYFLSKIFNIKLVIDFRDPWGDDVFYKYNKRNTFTKWIETNLISSIVDKSNKIITISKGEAIEILNRFPYLNDDKVTHIENGFDPDDFNFHISEQTDSITSSKLTFTYIGSIYEGTTEEFFEGLKIVKDNYTELYNELKIIFIGSNSDHVKSKTYKYGISEIIEIIEYLPHSDCLASLSKSDVNLILLGGDNFPASEIPAKTYEYLYFKKPILAVAKPGDLTEILINSGLGVIIEPCKPELVAENIVKLLRNHIQGDMSFTPNNEFIQKFNRVSLTERLTNILENIIK
jgi:glycosyltransferase involved in cell wall biosynthesis